MGRIFLSQLVTCILLFFLGFNICMAQNSYYVFKKSGKPFLNIDAPVLRGSVIGTSDVLLLHKKDTVFLINEVGELFELKQANSYAYNSLKNYKKQEEADSFTKKYFSYVWKQFTNQQKTRQRPGVVYREDRNIKLLSPKDSIKKYVPEIFFKWKNNTDSTKVYFHLQEVETNHIFKIGLTGNEIKLYRDNFILKNGRDYKWAVTKEPYPNFSEVKFNNFELLNKDSYLALKKEMETLTLALQLLGFSDEDIKTAICLDYKFCEN
ncbi:hypothetical protein CLV90_0546 [Maribacter spongiicola]|uniref:Uncharacterized protein n=1 Tax=Maribacter spongiicola TaxID=1206753 RepID=A0A4R7K5K2_9FLAO|nr:hypothetical protein [Maribacter spongiicola]TDT46495.1 hypothetical protein CLV90_0546 [Maribacter spongiicola]